MRNPFTEAADDNSSERRVRLLSQQRCLVSANGEHADSSESLLMARDGTPVEIQATEASRVLVLTSEQLDESVVVQGPFVTNTCQEICGSIQSYKLISIFVSSSSQDATVFVCVCIAVGMGQLHKSFVRRNC
ncbi:MAG: hypothetical protein KDB22_07600 [Planctomycetales bacterium]|nr:hypothetical protein [Planctomycetales bacterium]